MQKIFKHPTPLVDTLIATIALFLLGLVLLIWPEGSALAVCYIAAALLCAYGAYNVVCYFLHAPGLGVMNPRFTRGVIALVVGLVIFVRPGLLASVLPVAMGCVLVLGGVVKLQVALDLMRMHMRLWWLDAIAAALSVTAGAIAIANPFALLAMLTRFIGLSLLVEAVLDISTLLAVRRIKRLLESRS